VIAEPQVCKFNPERDHFRGGYFPKNFRWSLATAAYQIEGAWQADGKGENIWDVWSHQNISGHCNVDECMNGDVACDSYNQIQRDIDNIVRMNVKNYRFSLSWTRLMPNGTRKDGNRVNQKGIDHYNGFIDKLIENGITPFVTIYHWDLPQALQNKYLGWLSIEKDYIVTDFADYARLCFESFGDRVKYWITLNEPEVTADEGYGGATMAPGITGNQWRARYNTIRAHSAAYEVYKTEFKEKQKGNCGITLNSGWYEPKQSDDEHEKAARLDIDFQLGFWAHPIFVNGNYPSSVTSTLAQVGINLPQFTAEEIQRNNQSADFFGVNHYSTVLVEPCSIGSPNCPFGFQESVCANWPTSGSDWLKSVPWGMRSLMKYIDRTYDTKRHPVFITENGISSKGNGTDMDPELDDIWRVDFYNAYIGQLQRAISEDGVNVRGYTAWSLMDNFEWSRGYTQRFGMMWTNYTDPNRAVYRKQSSINYEHIATTNTIPGNENDPAFN